MCGLAGFVNLDGAPADAGVLSAMMRQIRHRGPDDSSQLITDDTALGFQRLKILDLSDHGRQPMVTPDRQVAFVFNGEVYNAFDYKAELEAAGYRFRSKTDTEVLLYLYERHGIDGMLARLNGMFAFAIADRRTREVHLARDQFGIKPLYFTQCGASVLFASETKAFLAHPAFKAEIDERHVDEQLAFRYVAGDASLLRGVFQVRPGHRVRIAGGVVTTIRYWSMPEAAPQPALAIDDAVEQLDVLMRRTVASQLRSDVKVGSQLSGGVDSSLVTAYASAQAESFDAFSVVFEDPKFSEEPWIDEAATLTGARRWSVTFTADTFLEPLSTAAWHMDQPISHPNAIGLWWLAASARDKVTVLLSGEGADEVFAGYSRYIDADRKPVEAMIRATQLQPESKLARLRPGADLAPALARRAHIFDEGTGDPLSKWLHYERQTYLVDLLVRQDKMMMAHGIENRVPFLDRAIVEFAQGLPGRCLAADGATKIVLKQLARRTFNDAFAAREKRGFALPLSQYFRNKAFTDLMEDVLLPGMRQRGLVSEPAVRELWRRSLSAPALTEVLWLPVALELWAQQFVDRRSLVQASA